MSAALKGAGVMLIVLLCAAFLVVCDAVGSGVL
jgi:hypothetical protein